MKTDRVSKLYENLSNKERALLSFHHLVTGNSVEADRIGETVPWRTYQCRDPEYLVCLQVLFHIANYWGMEHWKAQTRRMAAVGGMQIVLARENFAKLKAFTAAHELWEARLLALDAALTAVCSKQRIDPETVRAWTNTEVFRPLCDDLAPDSEYQAEIEAGLAGLVEASGWADGR